MPSRIPEPDEVLSLAAEVKYAREKLKEAETKWARLFIDDGEPPVAVESTRLKPRIVQLLEEHPDHTYSVSSVVATLDANENSVGPYLSTLATEGRIERRGRGVYGALRPMSAGRNDMMAAQEESPAPFQENRA